MIDLKLTRLLALAALIFSANAIAAGDPAAGEGKSAICAACHGADGNSSVGEWPKLAGQHETYTVRQIGLFQSGARVSAVMAPMIANLSEQDTADLAAYFAAKEVKPGVADDTVVALGERVFRAGNAPTGVPACLACHGPRGRGNPGAGYPALMGQHAAYTANVLRQFKAGTVWGEGKQANAVMAAVAANLTEAEILAVASYIEGLH